MADFPKFCTNSANWPISELKKAQLSLYSSNENVVTVEDGILTVVGVGSSNISATADGVESNICVVNVSEL